MTDPILSLWQNQKLSSADTAPISLEEIKHRSHSMHRRTVWRDRIEYAAGAFVLLLFGAMAVGVPLWSLKLGSLAIMIGTCLTLWNLHKRRSHAPDFAMKTGRQCSEYHRAQLIHQRDMLRSVWRWYLAPLIPGMLVFLGAVTIEVGQKIGWLKALEGVGPIAAAIFGFFGLIHLLNRWAARKLQREIDALSA